MFKPIQVLGPSVTFFQPIMIFFLFLHESIYCRYSLYPVFAGVGWGWGYSVFTVSVLMSVGPLHFGF